MEEGDGEIVIARKPGYLLWENVFYIWHISSTHKIATVWLPKNFCTITTPVDMQMWLGEISQEPTPRYRAAGKNDCWERENHLNVKWAWKSIYNCSVWMVKIRDRWNKLTGPSQMASSGFKWEDSASIYQAERNEKEIRKLFHHGFTESLFWLLCFDWYSHKNTRS